MCGRYALHGPISRHRKNRPIDERAPWYPGLVDTINARPMCFKPLREESLLGTRPSRALLERLDRFRAGGLKLDERRFVEGIGLRRVAHTARLPYDCTYQTGDC
jgi:hypothetical protein